MVRSLPKSPAVWFRWAAGPLILPLFALVAPDFRRAFWLLAIACIVSVAEVAIRHVLGEPPADNAGAQFMPFVVGLLFAAAITRDLVLFIPLGIIGRELATIGLLIHRSRHVANSGN